MPPDGHADRRDDQDSDGGRTVRSGGAPAEDRDLEEYYVALYRAALTEKTVAARQAAAEEQAAYEKWEKKTEDFRWMWSEYQRRLPPGERAPVDRSRDPPGSWHGEGDRFLKPAENDQVEAACDRITKLERDKITPAMREVESQDPDRHLVGVKDCLKGHDRIKEKAYDKRKEFGYSLEEAVSAVSDTIRFTFQYSEAYYTQGVWADIGRLEEQGFEQKTRRNCWSGEEYKGINSQWIEPESGQRFEVQFHTRISFEAKQLTHDAYEILRTKKANKFEEHVLDAFQKKISADVPVPPGAVDIPDYP